MRDCEHAACIPRPTKTETEIDTSPDSPTALLLLLPLPLPYPIASNVLDIIKVEMSFRDKYQNLLM